MAINFISSKDSEETCDAHTKGDILKIMISNKTDEFIGGLFNLRLKRYQKGLEENVSGSDFVYDSVDLLYYKFHRISLNWGGSYIDSRNRWKSKKQQ